MLPLFLRVPVSSEEVSGHLSVKVRGINVGSLSTSACVKVREVSGHLSVKVRGIDVVSLSTSACVK